MLDLVEKDLNKNDKSDKNTNSEPKLNTGPSVIIPLNNEDIQKLNLNQDNKIENKKIKTEKDNKDSVNNEKSIYQIFILL